MSRRRAFWHVLRRVLVAAFFLAVAFLLLRFARLVNWPGVGAAIAGYESWQLAAAGAMTVLSYLIYGSYDLLGRSYTGHALTRRRVLGIAFVSYAFNLNLGTLVGGAGFRYRLYSRAGLGFGTISGVLGMSIATNWLGYLPLAGLAFVTHSVPVPSGWELGATALEALGGLMLVILAAYLALCGLTHDRHWRLRGHPIKVPSLPVAFLQLVLSSANWLIIVTIVYLFLPEQIGYGVVLGVMLLGAVAGVMAHIPAGLGVLEAVFIALLGGHIAQHELLAALLTYRAIYYFCPLLLALLLYLGFEAGVKGGDVT